MSDPAWQMEREVVDLRLAVYDHILDTGRIPLAAQLAERVSLPIADVGRELRRLQDIHAFALAPASDEILIAHPFSAVPTPYVVRTQAHSFWVARGTRSRSPPCWASTQPSPRAAPTALTR